ncbi:MAG TPA: hypothetical protein VK324_11840, partial [Tepidisphaeraceae bacterium]|nr:hypothetical protein [Tepidisphaeraceae bacterium]
LKLDKGIAANLAGRITGVNVSASGPALSGDTFATRELVLDVPPTVLAMPNGLGEFAGARVRIGDEQDGQPIALTFDQGSFAVTGDASQDAGKVSATANVDVGRLAQQLPRTVKLQEGVTLTGGRLSSTNDISFTGDRAAVSSSTKLENVAGTNKGKPVALRPITVTAGATKAGQGELLRALRDVSLSLASGFATIDVKGPSVGDITGNVRGELAEAQRELGQFVDFGSTTLAGAFNVDLRGTGGVPSPTNPVTIATTATITNLQYAAADQDPIRQPLVKLTAGGKLTPGDDASKQPTRIDDAAVALLTGSEQAPSLRVDAKAVAELLTGGGFNVPSLTITTLTADLDRLRQEMPGVVPAGAGTAGGTVDATLTASARGDGTTTSIVIPSLRVTRNGDQPVADVTDTNVVLANGLQSADVNLSMPDLKSAYALAQAFQAPPPALKEGEEPAAPLLVTAGNLTVKANVTQGASGGLVLKVPTLAGQNIGVAQGDGAYQIGSLAGTIDTTTEQAGNVLRPRGNITFGNLVVLRKGQPQATENELAAAFDLALDQAKKDATIHDFVVDAKSSGAVKVTAKGAVRDYAASRTFEDVVVNLAGDWAKLWPLAKPFVAPEPDSPLADMKIAGPIDRQFRVSGSLPANVPFNQAIKTLRAEGGLAIAQLQAYGLDVQNLDVPVTLADGRAATVGPDGKVAAPAACNGGTIDVGNFVVDLTTNTNRLTIPPGKKILAGVALNGVLAKSLNSYGVPLFAESNSEAAKFDLTCVHCDALPVKDLSATAADGPGGDDDHGTAEFRVSFTNVVLGGDVVAGLDQAIRLTGNDTGIADQLRGDVRDAKVTLAGGRVTIEDFTLQGGQKGRELLSFAGGAGLGARGRLNLTANLPPDLLERAGRDVAAFFPNGIGIPIA